MKEDTRRIDDLVRSWQSGFHGLQKDVKEVFVDRDGMMTTRQ